MTFAGAESFSKAPDENLGSIDHATNHAVLMHPYRESANQITPIRSSLRIERYHQIEDNVSGIERWTDCLTLFLIMYIGKRLSTSLYHFHWK